MALPPAMCGNNVYTSLCQALERFVVVYRQHRTACGAAWVSRQKARQRLSQQVLGLEGGDGVSPPSPPPPHRLLVLSQAETVSSGRNDPCFFCQAILCILKKAKLK